MEQYDVCCEEDHEIFEMICLSKKQRRRGWLLERNGLLLTVFHSKGDLINTIRLM